MTAKPDEDQTGAPRRVPAWMHLAQGDKRLALVTFGATLAANIATVVVVALAVIAYHVQNAITRLMNTPSEHGWNVPWWALVALFALAVAIVCVSLNPRAKRIRDSWPMLILTLVPGLFGLLMVIIMALATLGELAGVR